MRRCVECGEAQKRHTGLGMWLCLNDECNVNDPEWLREHAGELAQRRRALYTIGKSYGKTKHYG